ncbi:MAG: hypothetical protein LLG20_23905 [Acidobacteriales bacterium]|nr:hypothetical protein [Terriglobales bacterium]
MPNWCSNHLDIDGPIAVVDHFLAVFAERGFAWHKPEPEGAESDPQYDWHEWRTRNWGTKWNVARDYWSVVSAETTGDCKRVRISFMTAWSPPDAWLRAVAARYLDRPVHFRLAFLEEGMGFSGVVEIWCEGKIEQTIVGSCVSEDPFDTVAYREALFEFDSDAWIPYSVVAEIHGARLRVSSEMSARYPWLAQARDALLSGQGEKALKLIGPSIRSTFDAREVESAEELLSSVGPACPDGNIQTDIETVTFHGDTLTVSARVHFSAAFAVPFVSVEDFCETCNGNQALGKGVRLWLEDFEFEDYELITVQPVGTNWPNRGLASLESIFEKDTPRAV